METNDVSLRSPFLCTKTGKLLVAVTAEPIRDPGTWKPFLTSGTRRARKASRLSMGW